MHQRTDAADTLREGPGIARVAPAQDDLDAANHGSGRVCLRDTIAVHLRLDAQMAFDTGNGINDDTFIHEAYSLL